MNLQKILEEIKNRIDIVELISEYVTLTKTGQNYKALCPFHAEKTPSFFVSPSKQIFHCFGCGKGGDIVSFLIEYEKISFNEAISILASKAGINLQLQHQSAISKDLLFKIYESASKFFREKLRESERAKRYLQSRGISQESIEIFGIGYALAGKNHLYEHLKKEGFDEKTIAQSKLCVNSSDFFQDRIIIPITDLTGKIIAFGGRALENRGEIPKYINSPDTPIFKKGNTIFGLHQAKQYIKEKGYAIIMEGYIDVILSHQYGFKNSIAPLGTALTNEQLNKIKRFTNKLLLLFDGDEAGIQAADRSLTAIFQSGFVVKITVLPRGHDPASILQRFGERELRKFIAKAQSPVDFYLNAPSRKTINERVYEILAKIGFLKNLIYRDELIKEISEKTEISELTLREELRKIRKDNKNEKSPFFRERSCLLNEEEIILRVGLSYPERLPSIFKYLKTEMIENPMVRELFIKLESDFSKESFSITNFLNKLSEEQKAFVSKLIITTEIEENSVGQILNDCFRKIKIKYIDRKIKEIAKSGDEKYLQQLIHEKREILRCLNEGL